MDYTERETLERRLVISEELLRRRQGDPLRLFKPHERQQEFIDSVLEDKFPENWFLAANRAGKSDAGALIGATLARFGDQSSSVRSQTFQGGKIEIKDRATSGWVTSLDFPSSRDIIQPKYFDNGFIPPGATHEPFIPAREIADWRISDQILKLKNGSIIGFKSADSGRTKFQGTEKDYVHFDEEPPFGIYEECVIRVGQRPLKVFATCTLLPPEGQVGGITWVYNDKVKPWKAGKLPNIGIYNASIYDNPSINPMEIERLEAIYPEGSPQRRIRLNGELIAGLSGARVYSSFSYALNVKEQGEINLRAPLCWIWDFNVEPMVSLLGQRDKGVFRVFRELIMDEGNIPEMCEYFRQVHPRHMAEIHVYGDATGKHRTAQTRRTSYQIILNSMNDYPVPLRMKVPESNPAVTDRINSMNRTCYTEEARVMLEIDPDCAELCDDLEQVVGDGKGGIKKTFNKKDPYYRRTHTSDALGYWIARENPVGPINRDFQQTRKIRTPRPSYAPQKRFG